MVNGFEVSVFLQKTETSNSGEWIE